MDLTVYFKLLIIQVLRCPAREVGHLWDTRDGGGCHITGNSNEIKQLSMFGSETRKFNGNENGTVFRG